MRRPAALNLLRGAAALVWTGAATGAWAQDADLLADFRLDELPAGRGAFVTVRERPQPLWDPVPMRVGGVELMPRATAQGFYDSNVFAIRNADDDLGLRLSAAATARRVSGGTTIRADGEVERRQYLEHGGQSTTDFAAGASLRHRFAGTNLVEADVRAGRETESLVDPSAPLNSVRPSQFDYVAASLGGARSFGRLRIAGRLGLEDRRFEDGRDILGNPIDQSFRNRLMTTAEAGAEYQLTPERSLFVHAIANRRDYREPDGPEPVRDSSGFRVEAGAAFMLTPLIRSRISAGWFRQDFEDLAFPTLSGLALRGQLDYAVTPLVTLSLSGSRSVEEASTLGTGAYVATRVALRADYELLRNLILSASAGYEKDDFQAVDRLYSIWRASLGASYRLSRRLRLNAGYEGRDQDSSGAFPGRDFVRHEFTVGVTIEGI